VRRIPISAVLGLAFLCWAFSLILSDQKVVFHGVPLYLAFLVLSLAIILWSIGLFIHRQQG